MKIQDIVFLLIFAIVIFARKPKLAVGLGLACIIISIPLFAKYIFFTAEHLTWYAGGFFLLAIILFIINGLTSSKNENK